MPEQRVAQICLLLTSKHLCLQSDSRHKRGVLREALINLLKRKALLICLKICESHQILAEAALFLFYKYFIKVRLKPNGEFLKGSAVQNVVIYFKLKKLNSLEIY